VTGQFRVASIVAPANADVVFDASAGRDVRSDDLKFRIGQSPAAGSGAGLLVPAVARGRDPCSRGRASSPSSPPPGPGLRRTTPSPTFIPTSSASDAAALPLLRVRRSPRAQPRSPRPHPRATGPVSSGRIGAASREHGRRGRRPRTLTTTPARTAAGSPRHRQRADDVGEPHGAGKHDAEHLERRERRGGEQIRDTRRLAPGVDPGGGGSAGPAPRPGHHACRSVSDNR
jgi:hypothetical protein